MRSSNTMRSFRQKLCHAARACAERSSGWTQEELAKKERKGKSHISRMLIFGRFLGFLEAENDPEIKISPAGEKTNSVKSENKIDTVGSRVHYCADGQVNFSLAACITHSKIYLRSRPALEGRAFR
jgi:hypothetical protein